MIFPPFFLLYFQFASTRYSERGVDLASRIDGRTTHTHVLVCSFFVCARIPYPLPTLAPFQRGPTNRKMNRAWRSILTQAATYDPRPPLLFRLLRPFFPFALFPLVNTHTTTKSGGGVRVFGTSSPSRGATVSIVDSLFEDNYAPHGGGLWLSSVSLLTVARSVLHGNKASYFGGGASVESTEVAEFTACNFTESYAYNGAGGERWGGRVVVAVLPSFGPETKSHTWPHYHDRSLLRYPPSPHPPTHPHPRNQLFYLRFSVLQREDRLPISVPLLTSLCGTPRTGEMGG